MSDPEPHIVFQTKPLPVPEAKQVLEHLSQVSHPDRAAAAAVALAAIQKAYPITDAGAQTA